MCTIESQNTELITPWDFWLSYLYRLSSQKKMQIYAMGIHPDELYRMSEKAMNSLHLFEESEIKLLIQSRQDEYWKEYWYKLQNSDIRFIPFFHPDYPERLLDIYDAPFSLYVKGKLPDPKKKSVSIVGARMCSEYGRSIGRKLGETLAEHQVEVISGMALGIDSAAHAGALSFHGKTYAVLGCGCDICYPRSARNLYKNIQEEGGIISEYYPGVQPLPMFFPQRNRIISGLADIVVIVEAKEKSGSLITADIALDQGKDIYAVPGRFQEPLSFGCNRLIEQGAGILYDMDNFLKNTGIVSDTRKKYDNLDKIPLEKEEIVVYSCLDLHPKFINLIIEETGLNLLTVLHSLDRLRQKGLVQETFQNYFCRIL